MDDSLRTIIEGIHGSGRALALAVTGGGSSAIARLLEVPGGSRSLIEALVPYHTQALEEFLGGPVLQACSDDTARSMSVRAWERAHARASSAMPIGLGLTASLVSDRPKRG